MLNQDFKEFVKSLNDNDVHPRRIDILTTLPGVEFSECYSSRLMVEIESVPVAFIGLDSLIKNKRASGRHQDLADLENLE